MLSHQQRQDIAANHSGAAELMPLNECKKVYVPRDYTYGLTVRFQTKLPQELQGRIEEATWERVVNDLNLLYEQAEMTTGRSVCETFLSCVTCYLSQMCSGGQYDKYLKMIAQYIYEQNEKTFQPKGLFITDPIERGLRVIEIILLNESSQTSAPHYQRSA